MIDGRTLALAHLAICLAGLAAAWLSAHRARHGLRTGRSGRYRRLSTRQMLKRIDAPEA